MIENFQQFLLRLFIGFRSFSVDTYGSVCEMSFRIDAVDPLYFDRNQLDIFIFLTFTADEFTGESSQQGNSLGRHIQNGQDP